LSVRSPPKNLGERGRARRLGPVNVVNGLHLRSMHAGPYDLPRGIERSNPRGRTLAI
jgi:hypothetical protein